MQHLGVADGEQRTSGDTTHASAQLRALAHFGVTARLVQNADFQLIEQQINRGIPVPCGYIHRGPVDRPTGSGNWLIHGTTLNTNGMGLRFSRKNFGKRWMVEPIGGCGGQGLLTPQWGPDPVGPTLWVLLRVLASVGPA